MNVLSVINGVLAVATVIGALSGATFMIIYTKRSLWWRTEHRAHLGWTTLSLTMILLLYVFRAVMDPLTFAYVRAPLFLGVVACMVWRLLLLLRSRRPDRARNDAEDANSEVQ